MKNAGALKPFLYDREGTKSALRRIFFFCLFVV